MYFGELIVLAIVVICLHGLYDTVVEAIRRRHDLIRPIIENDDSDR